MPRIVTEAEMDQRRRIAHVRLMLTDAISTSGERDISILLAALVDMLSRVSDWNLEAESKAQE